MKRWGWASKASASTTRTSPSSRPFVLQAVDLDLNTSPAPPMKLEDLPIPTPVISDELLEELTEAVGIDNAFRRS